MKKRTKKYLIGLLIAFVISVLAGLFVIIFFPSESTEINVNSPKSMGLISNQYINYDSNSFNEKSLFFHDSTGKYYTNDERDYLELVISYSSNLISDEEYQKAIEILNKAIEKDFSFYGIWINMGNAYVGLKKYDGAISSYDEAIRKNPSSRLAWNNKCFLLLELNKAGELNNCLNELSKLR